MENRTILFITDKNLMLYLTILKGFIIWNIVADDPEILENTWTSPIDNLPQDTIIRLICTSFNLSYTKDGNVYHLSKK